MRCDTWRVLGNHQPTMTCRATHRQHATATISPRFTLRCPFVDTPWLRVTTANECCRSKEQMPTNEVLVCFVMRQQKVMAEADIQSTKLHCGQASADLTIVLTERGCSRIWRQPVPRACKDVLTIMLCRNVLDQYLQHGVKPALCYIQKTSHRCSAHVRCCVCTCMMLSMHKCSTHAWTQHGQRL